MLLEFNCYAVFGKGDGTDWTQEFEITDEEYVRLKEASERGTYFRNDEDVRDIYDRLYAILITEATEILLEEDEDLADEYGEDSDFTADELYDYGLDYPDALYDDFDDEVSELEND